MFIDTLFTLASIAGDTPVIADADTGFGSTLNIARTVQMYERAGVAAFHIEDQVMYVCIRRATPNLHIKPKSVAQLLQPAVQPG